MPTDAAARPALERRLADELDDPALAATVAAGLPDDILEALARGGDFATTPLLSYRPARMPDDQVESLWILAYGYRLRTHADWAGDGIPPIHALAPGPVNEELAGVAAEFVTHRPVPVIAQWEVAEALANLGVPDVISVEPDVAADGSVVYLSTAGVLEKGLRLATAAGIAVGQVGVLGHADHVNRCLLTAEASGRVAAVPGSTPLPTAYDPESGQPWTRSRAAFVPVDLMARTLFA